MSADKGWRAGWAGWLLAWSLAQAIPGFAVWDVSTVDATGDVGWYASLTISSSNQPMIGYYDATNRHLKYTRFDGSNWNCETVDSSSNCGQGTSLARESGNDYPHISYLRNNSLYYAKWTGSWTITYVASQSSWDIMCTSIVLDSNQHPNISYNSSGVSFIRYNGSVWDAPAGGISGSGYMESSLALDNSNVPHLAYFDNGGSGGGDVRVARLNGTSWYSGPQPSTNGDNDGYWPSLKLGPGNTMHISCWGNTQYHKEWSDAQGNTISVLDDSDLKYYVFNGSSWDYQIADVSLKVGLYSSLALDGAQKAHISYFDQANWALKYATNSSGAWANQTVDNLGGVGYYTSIALDSSGNPSIAYYDLTNKDLKYAHWVPGAYALRGVIRDGTSAPKAGVYVFLTDGTLHANTITQSDGSYAFTGIPAGTYSCVPNLAGWSFSPSQYTYTALSADQNNQDFTILPGSGYFIRGYVTDAAGRQIGKNVLVTLSGAGYGSMTTGISGYYEFVNLTPGQYTVTPALNGYTFSPADRTYAALGANQDSQGFVGLIIGQVFSLQGTIRNPQGQPVPQITVQAQGTSFTVSTLTGNDGSFTLLGLPHAVITLQPQSTEWVFDPLRKTYSPLGQNFTAEDFTAIKGAALPQEVKIIGGLFKPLAGEHASIWYTLTSAGNVVIKLYSIDGVLVKTLVDGRREAGTYQEIWAGLNKDNQTVASGIYWVDIQMPGSHVRKKICAVK